AAGVVMAAVMAGVRASLGGLSAALVAVPVGLLAYAASLYALGVDARDRLVVTELAARYRRTLAGVLRR
ncbi:MAG: lipopolysaccharide biosynthesis protein, partial [Halobacterium sp.]